MNVPQASRSSSVSSIAESFMQRADAATESWAKRPISRIFFFGM
jgi:hypothetical protein